STFRAHLGDRDVEEVEAYALSRTTGLAARTVVFRPGHVLSPRSRAAAHLRRFGACHPLVPRRLRSCCVEGGDLFAAIEEERPHGRRGRRRAITILGPNRPWREWLAQHRGKGILQTGLSAVCTLLSLLLVGHIASLVLNLFARRRPALRRWNFDTLRPRSF